MTTLANTALTIHTTTGRIRLPGDTLLVFLDETGSEDLSDPVHPVFGLGGCVTTAGQYGSILDVPWKRLKEQHFPDVKGALHAADLRPSAEGAQAIGDFFRERRFGRVAALISNRTDISVEHHRYQLTVTALVKRIDAVALTFWPFSSALIVIESSARADRLAKHFLGPYDRFVAEADGIQAKIPVRTAFSQKSTSLAGLEVADFVMHAAGGAVRVGGRRGRQRKDYVAVFKSQPPGYGGCFNSSAVAPGPRRPSGST